MSGQRLNARERLDRLFDANTFVELGRLVTHRCANFGMQAKVSLGDGIVGGFGKISGQTVYAYAQDAAVMGGSLGEAHANKICSLMERALKSRAPIVAMLDSGGARIQEGVDALAGYGRIFRLNMKASGVVPQIAAVMGACAGGAVYSPALMDCVLMVRGQSHMFVTGPSVIKAVTGETVSPDDLGGTDMHSATSGVAHFAADSEQETIDMIRHLLMLYATRPGGHARAAVPQETHDVAAWDTVLPQHPGRAYDMRRVIHLVADGGQFMECMAGWARNILTGFIHANGVTAGVVANQPNHLAGCLDINASDKAARFIRLCDAFGIPIVTLVDVPGFLPGLSQEHGGIIRHGAKMLYAYSEASVPRITVVLRKAYGGAYLAMSCKELGTDFVFAWPQAEIAVMGAEAAANIIFRNEGEAERATHTASYQEMFCTPYYAAARGMVDEVIRPADTRAAILRALDALSTKRLCDIPHGNMPV